MRRSERSLVVSICHERMKGLSKHKQRTKTTVKTALLLYDDAQSYGQAIWAVVDIGTFLRMSHQAMSCHNELCVCVGERVCECVDDE